MKLVVYTEGPWTSIMKADEYDTDFIEVPNSIGRKWLEAQEAWETASSDIRSFSENSK